MIPVSRWLECESLPVVPINGSAPESQEPFEIRLTKEEYFLQLETARQEVRREMEIQLSMSQEAADGRLTHSLQERDDEWKSRVALLVDRGLARYFAELKDAISASLSTVMEPFLREKIISRARDVLCSLIDEEFARNPDSITEIRAPSSLHPFLEEIFLRRNIGAHLTDSDSIELLTRHGCSRFELMSQKWLGAMQDELK